MGETNPHILTWDELMADLGLAGRGVAKDASIEALREIDAGVPVLQLERGDFRDVRVGDERVITAAQVRASVEKFARIPMGTHRCTLVIEDLKEKLDQRIMRLSRDEDVHDSIMDLPNDEQIRIFGQQLAPLGDDEMVAYARQYLTKLYRPAVRAIEEGDWLKLDRIGMRMLGKGTLDSVEWLYLKLALVGGGKRHARYVMVDEVQDYTTTQLAVLARYFPNAHFLMLGDENQAVHAGTASFAEIRDLFRDLRGSVDECSLMISYRSSPEITALFTSLLPEDERVQAASVQRPGVEPLVIECDSGEEYEAALRDTVDRAAGEDCLTALIANSRSRASRFAPVLQSVMIASASLVRNSSISSSSLTVQTISFLPFAWTAAMVSSVAISSSSAR